MFGGAFGAGFAQGFGTTLAKGIEDRREQREKYIDLTLDNARATAPAFAESEMQVQQLETMMQNMNDDFGITNEEFIGLAQSYDINAIYKNVYSAKAVMENNGIKGQIDKSMILGGLKLPENFQLPEGVTPEQGLRMIFQGVIANTDPNNKSESHKAGAFGKAVSQILQLNPKASAQDMIQGMQVAGVPVEKLIQFQATGGVKQTPFSDVETSGPFKSIDIDYTDAQFKTTTNTFASVFSRKFAKSDDPMDIATLLSRDPKALSDTFGENASAEAVYSQVFSAGNTMARLEKQLIAKGLSVGFGQSNARYDAMSGIAARIESVTEMQQLVKLIEAGDPVADRIVEAYGNDQMITDKEMDYILTGTRVSSSEAEEAAAAAGDTPSKPVVPERTKQETIDAFSADQEARLAGEDDALPKGDEPFGMAPVLPSMGTRPIPKMASAPQLPEDKLSEDNQFTANIKQIASERDVDMNATGAAARAAQLEVFQEAYIPQMKKVTHQEWRNMSRDERIARGLPESNFDVAMYGGGSRNFKDGFAWNEGFKAPKDGPQAGDERSRLDAEGNVKPEVKAAEDEELFTDIDAEIIAKASEELPEFASIFEAEAFAKEWLTDNIPEYETLGYDPINVAQALLLAYSNDDSSTPASATTADTEVTSIVDQIQNN